MTAADPSIDSRSATPRDEPTNELLDVLAHELRGPLAAIAAAGHVLDELLSKVPAPERARAERVLAIHARQVDIAKRMVDDLLDVRRLRTGKLVLRRADMDLVPIVREAVDAHRAGMERAGIHLRVILPTEPLMSRVDAGRIEQIVGNLLSNAIKYTGCGGHIEVEVSSEAAGDDEAQALIHVRDDGTGIPPDELSLVFERYVRLGHTREQGLGIGLSLVRRIATLHGGEVSVWSAGEGAGSTFTVRLPLRTARPSAPPELTDSGRIRLPRLAQGLVLVVDDDADLRELLRFQLELGGSEVIEATNAEEALALARVRRPQVALIDLALPTMGGLALAERMRTDPERSKIRLIAMSGYGGSEARRRSAEVGFAEHLVKPITLEELERALSAGEPRG